MKYTDYISNHYATEELKCIRSKNNPYLYNDIRKEKEVNTEALKVHCLVFILVVITLLNI